MNQAKNFQEFIISLTQYWTNFGCIWSQPYDSHMGAGTFHPHTFLKGLGPEPWRSVYVQPCRRPVDGRYGKSPYRFQHYYQLQVLLKPSPSNIVDIFLQSLEHVGINLKNNDIGLLEDDWKGPTLGAWGLGWEVRANGQEVSQFTYFQQLGGIDIDVVCGEITYGLERLFMYSTGAKNALDMPFNDNFTYGDIFYQNEYEFSFFNFKEADISELLSYFEKSEEKVYQLCEKNLILPAYDYVLQASHAFNLLDARGAISVSERQRYIGRVRDCAKKCAAKYKEGREKLGHPLIHKLDNDPRKPIYPQNNPNINLTSQDLSTTSLEKYIDSVNNFKDKEHVHVTFELGVEEMPPSFQIPVYNELREKLEHFIHLEEEKFKNNSEFLAKLNSFKNSQNIKINVSSRRISLQLTHTPIQEPDQKIELWGPAERIAKDADGILTPAGLGFCKKNNIEAHEIIFKLRPEGTFLYCEKIILGKNFPLLLAEEFKSWCYSLNAPLKMKWLPPEISPPFIRPVRTILSLVEDKVIPLQMFGISSCNHIHGQRILSPELIPVMHAKDYEKTLENLGIKIDPKERREFILKEANEICKEIDGNLIIDEGLINKCVGLYESPYVFCAQFDESYLKLPDLLITSVLKEHMNYFTIQDKNKKCLLPYYIGVANYTCSNINDMIAGTKNVVTGRLDDGTFYFDTDIATPLSEFREKLKSQTFQENMGTLYDKSERLARFSKLIFSSLQDETLDLQIMQTAAIYCKADLKSGCVHEFPDEMQGIMGGVLARKQNILPEAFRSEQVAQAIEQHYLPTGAHSILPVNKYALILSLIDKLDSLGIMINHGIELKGNKDPFGMRRLGLSIARIIGLKQDENFINLSLNDCVTLCINNLKNSEINIDNKTEQKFITFLLDRVKSSLKEEFDPRAVDSLTQKLIHTKIPSVIHFIKVIDQHIKDPQCSLLEALNPYRRARNLTLNLVGNLTVNTNMLTAPAEKKLHNFILSSEIKLAQLIHEQNYAEVLQELESLALPLAEFFNTVMVNDNNLLTKENRQALLLKIRNLYEGIADFSILQV